MTEDQNCAQFIQTPIQMPVPEPMSSVFLGERVTHQATEAEELGGVGGFY